MDFSQIGFLFSSAKKNLNKLFFIALAGIFTYCQAPNSEKKVDEVLQEKAEVFADDSFLFEFTDGREIPFAPTSNQWTVLHFWATWCKPCIAEFPEIKKALPRLQSDDIQFLFISDEELEQIDAFQKKHSTGLELIRMKEGSLADFEIYALPTTIILNPDGKEVFRHAGMLRWVEFNSIEELIAEKP